MASMIGTELTAIIILIFTLILFIMDRLPIALTAMISAIAMALFGAMDYEEIYAGFASDLVMLVLGMLIVGRALFETGVVQIIGKKIMKSKYANNERNMIVILMIVVGSLSAFLSNTATIATFIPLIGAMVITSSGNLTNKNLLMPIAIAASVGGSITLVGSTAQPMTSSVLENYDLEGLGMFDFAWVAIPLFIVSIIYMATIGYKIQKKAFNFEDIVEGAGDGPPSEIKVTVKTYIAATTMVLAIISFAFEIFSPGITALMAAAIILTTKCLDFKKGLSQIDWNTVLLMAFAQGIAAGVDKSGAGEMIAKWTVDIVGNNPWTLFTIAILVTVILTNIMSNTAVAAMMTPIYIIIAANFGYSPYVFAIGIATAANASIATPIGGTAMSLVLVGGYSFRDYLKVGLPITVILTIMIIILTPLFYSF